jgi:hypothetical protein
MLRARLYQKIKDFVGDPSYSTGSQDGRWGSCNIWLVEHTTIPLIRDWKSKDQRKALKDVYPACPLVQDLSDELFAEYYTLVVKHYFTQM